MLRPSIERPPMISAADWFRSAEPLTFTTRADGVETVQGGHFAVVEAESGALVAQAGRIDLPAFPRSSLKFIQALPLVESGAADAFNLSPSHLTLACASHYAEEGHVALVEQWLADIGCEDADLACGPAFPWREADREATIRAGGVRRSIFHNCSGKHSGFLTVCRHEGWEIVGYDQRDHPAQQRYEANLLALSGAAAADVRWGVDGCALPTPALPLVDMARAMASFAHPKTETARGQAQARLLDAVAEAPWYLAGTDHFSVALATVTRGRIVGKIGADGYYAVAIRDRGWGLALKTLDGSLDVVDAALFSVLQRLGVLSDDEVTALSPVALKPVKNSWGASVGQRHVVL